MEGIAAPLDIDPRRHRREDYDRQMHELRATMPAEEFRRALEAGRAMTLADAVAFAREESAS
jgi:hypothetical protein